MFLLYLTLSMQQFSSILNHLLFDFHSKLMQKELHNNILFSQTCHKVKTTIDQS